MPIRPKAYRARDIPVPSRKKWRVLCGYLGITTPRDVDLTLDLADLDRRLAAALKKMSPDEAKRTLTLDRTVRCLAQRRSPYQPGDERMLPPNTLKELGQLPELLKRRYSRVCTWYVQRLIGLLHAWAIEGSPGQRRVARDLSRALGSAMVLGAERGRPELAIDPKDALREYEGVLRQVRGVWIMPVARRPGALRDALMRKFADSGTKVVRDEEYLASPEATPSKVALQICAAYRQISPRSLESLLAQARREEKTQAPTSRKK